MLRFEIFNCVNTGLRIVHLTNEDFHNMKLKDILTTKYAINYHNIKLDFSGVKFDNIVFTTYGCLFYCMFHPDIELISSLEAVECRLDNIEEFIQMAKLIGIDADSDIQKIIEYHDILYTPQSTHENEFKRLLLENF